MPESSWLARFDAGCMEADLPLLVLIRAAKNRNAHRTHGVPLLTDNEIRLQLLQERAEARELRRRADAGDKAAIAAIVREIAEQELAVERQKERNRVEWARLCAADD